MSEHYNGAATRSGPYLIKLDLKNMKKRRSQRREENEEEGEVKTYRGSRTLVAAALEHRQWRQKLDLGDFSMGPDRRNF